MLLNSGVALHEFDKDETEDQGTDDCFSSHQICGFFDISPGELRVFQQKKKFRTKRTPCYSCGENCPAVKSINGVSESAAQPEVEPKGDDVGQSFEEQVRVNAVTADLEIDGELYCEME